MEHMLLICPACPNFLGLPLSHNEVLKPDLFRRKSDKDVQPDPEDDLDNAVVETQAQLINGEYKCKEV